MSYGNGHKHGDGTPGGPESLVPQMDMAETFVQRLKAEAGIPVTEIVGQLLQERPEARGNAIFRDELKQRLEKSVETPGPRQIEAAELLKLGNLRKKDGNWPAAAR